MSAGGFYFYCKCRPCLFLMRVPKLFGGKFENRYTFLGYKCPVESTCILGFTPFLSLVISEILSLVKYVGADPKSLGAPVFSGNVATSPSGPVELIINFHSARKAGIFNWTSAVRERKV